MATTPPNAPDAPEALPTQPSVPYERNTRLSSILPPLIFGTATFNHQYNSDPFALDTVGLVSSALTHGIRAFDTSPYYGPAESLLGAALATPFVRTTFPRSSYFLLTKVGRIAAAEFDYSPEWVRASVTRSLQRLNTDYLDVVYCHDVEFVSAAEVLGAVKELRRIRDAEHSVRYVGISGYPLDVLGDLAELILRETGEPLDAVMSYANFTLQNETLAGPCGIGRLRAAGVDVVPNASPLGMGLLRREGVPVGALGDFHPASRELRGAVRAASGFCDRHGERLEVIALRHALESWLEAGAAVGSRGDPASGVPWVRESNEQVGGTKLGVSVIGVSRAPELEKTMLVWRSILDGLEGGRETAIKAGRWSRAYEWSWNRKRAVQILKEGVQEVLGDWVDYTWASPPPGFVNQKGVNAGADETVRAGKDKPKATVEEVDAPWLTPAASPEPTEGGDEVRDEKSIPLR
ncbi:Aldo/keto reductase [Glonium stellatum]|uniref:Aldo/keto reductase n=1 Tax=Glonium stellatum TaxID=574774 RepID=A0A8E2JQE6_9PEZI|nr:Aldo/keto reductase [Glonium stellatum]